MTNEDLCRLALAAIDDADARVVLADAIAESGWWDERLSEPRNERGYFYRLKAIGDYPRQDRDEFLGAVRHNAASLGTRCLCIAAVLLFGGWPTRWELAERCPLLVPYRWPTEMLRRYRQGDTEPALAVAQFPRDAVGDD